MNMNYKVHDATFIGLLFYNNFYGF